MRGDSAMMAYNWVTFFRNPQPPKKLSNQNPKPLAPKIESNKPVLVSLDIDGTLVPWQKSSDVFDQTAFLRYQHTLQEPALKKDSFVVLNTGRGLKATRQLAPMLARVPFDAIALNDGQQLFIKPKLNPAFHPIDANQRWILRLTQKQADPHWRKELNGWSTTRALKDIRDLLPELDFHPESTPREASRHFGTNDSYVFTKQADIWGNLWGKPKQDGWAISILPDQAYLEVKHVGKKVSESETKHYAKVLGDVIQFHLKDMWPNMTFKVVSTPERCFLHVGPKGNSKASLVGYLANRRLTNRPQAIVSAGDNVNDLPLLSLPQVGSVPNYPILVGKNSEAQKVLCKNPPPHLENVAWNQLHVGIEKQFQKIRPTLPAKALEPNPALPAGRINRLA